ncbi:MAG: iron-containing alcohol dehydrogenase [Lachnospiraceae bacterium]|nr:iron-containing alcohol dehydrogenase [Lachnospiraceae bacterium]
MYNFTFHVPTRIHFGKGQIKHLTELAESGSKVLLVYGGGSIKRAGIYDTAMGLMKEAGLTVFELSGVEPNPKIGTVRRGAEMCKKEGIDMVLAIGGGSTIDCAKVVAAAAKYDGDAWDLVLNSRLIKAALPIYSVLTLSATGSEMDNTAVISDLTKNEKWACAAPSMKPTMSILDPEYTYSVSKKQTAAGTADMMSHTFENYFSTVPGCDVQKRLAEGLLKVMIANGPVALREPDNYDARANLMWAASHAINGLVGDGVSQTWPIHMIEHELSAFYDITHGVGLAILTPVWMEFLLRGKAAAAPMGSDAYLAVMRRLARFGRNVFGLDAARRAQDVIVAESAVLSLKSFFFETLGIPATLSAVGITDEDNFEVMAEKAVKNAAGWYVPLTADEVVEIYRAAK